MVLKTGLLLLIRFNSKGLESSADKGISFLILGGTIILILKSTLKVGLKKNSKSFSKPTKNGETVGKISVNLSQAGIF